MAKITTKFRGTILGSKGMAISILIENGKTKKLVEVPVPEEKVADMIDTAQKWQKMAALPLRSRQKIIQEIIDEMMRGE